MQRAKTLWDWLKLLVIPIVLVVGAYLFNRMETQRAQEFNQRENLRTQAAEERRTRETALQEYFDQAGSYLVDRDSHDLSEGSSSTATAYLRARTMIILQNLSPKRNIENLMFPTIGSLQGSGETLLLRPDQKNLLDLLMGTDLRKDVLQFLYRTNLIERGNPVIRLSEADFVRADLTQLRLSGANLSGAILQRAHLQLTDLDQADLSQANLSYAKIIGTNLKDADLRGAKLQGADLTNADLTEADLTDATVTEGQLSACRSLARAIMPDGSKHT